MKLPLNSTFSCYSSTSLIKRWQLVKHHCQPLSCGRGNVPMVKLSWSATLLLMTPRLLLALLRNTRLENCLTLIRMYVTLLVRKTLQSNNYVEPRSSPQEKHKDLTALLWSSSLLARILSPWLQRLSNQLIELLIIIMHVHATYNLCIGVSRTSGLNIMQLQILPKLWAQSLGCGKARWSGTNNTFKIVADFRFESTDKCSFWEYVMSHT